MSVPYKRTSKLIGSSSWSSTCHMILVIPTLVFVLSSLIQTTVLAVPVPSSNTHAPSLSDEHPIQSVPLIPNPSHVQHVPAVLPNRPPAPRGPRKHEGRSMTLPLSPSSHVPLVPLRWPNRPPVPHGPRKQKERSVSLPSGLELHNPEGHPDAVAHQPSVHQPHPDGSHMPPAPEPKVAGKR